MKCFLIVDSILIYSHNLAEKGYFWTRFIFAIGSYQKKFVEFNFAIGSWHKIAEFVFAILDEKHNNKFRKQLFP